MSMFDKIRSFDRRNNEFGWNFVNGYTIPEMIGSISLHFAEAMVFYWWQMWQCPFEFCFFLLQGRVGSSFEQKSLNRGIWWTLSAQRFRSNQFHNFGFLGRLLLPPLNCFFSLFSHFFFFTLFCQFAAAYSWVHSYFLPSQHGNHVTYVSTFRSTAPPYAILKAHKQPWRVHLRGVGVEIWGGENLSYFLYMLIFIVHAYLWSMVILSDMVGKLNTNPL